jgi:hypothetical protein
MDCGQLRCDWRPDIWAACLPPGRSGRAVALSSDHAATPWPALGASPPQNGEETRKRPSSCPPHGLFGCVSYTMQGILQMPTQWQAALSGKGHNGCYEASIGKKDANPQAPSACRK